MCQYFLTVVISWAVGYAALYITELRKDENKTKL